MNTFCEIRLVTISASRRGDCRAGFAVLIVIAMFRYALLGAVLLVLGVGPENLCFAPLGLPRKVRRSRCIVCSFFSISYSWFTVSLSYIIYCLLFIDYCILVVAYCLLFMVYC